MSISTKTRISALLPSVLVGEMRRVSLKDNLTQSSIIKNALEVWFEKRLSQDAKDLSKINFDDLPSENDWNLIQPLID